MCETPRGVLTSLAFCSTVPFKEAKLPCTVGRTTNVKVYREPDPTRTRAARAVARPSPSPASPSPVAVQRAVASAAFPQPAPTELWCERTVLALLNRSCFVLMCCEMVCSGERAPRGVSELVKYLFFSQNPSDPNLIYLWIKELQPLLCASPVVGVR